MTNPLVPLLIVGMSLTFLVVMGLLLLVRRLVIHLIKKDQHP